MYVARSLADAEHARRTLMRAARSEVDRRQALADELREQEMKDVRSAGTRVRASPCR
jgi:hypothetical protein